MFKVGDLVIGKPEASTCYSWTTDRAVCKVVERLEGNIIVKLVKVLPSHEREDEAKKLIGESFSVNPNLFTLYEPPKASSQKELWDKTAERFGKARELLRPIYMALGTASGNEEIPECAFCKRDLQSEENECEDCGFAKVFGGKCGDSSSEWRRLITCLAEALIIMDRIVETAQLEAAKADVCPTCGKQKGGEPKKEGYVRLDALASRIQKAFDCLSNKNWLVLVEEKGSGRTVINFLDSASPENKKQIRAALLNLCPDCGQTRD